MTTIDPAAAARLSINELLDAAGQLSGNGQHDLAAGMYYAWLAYNDSPVAHALQFNLGVELGAAGDLAGAELAYRAALTRAPAFAPAWFNLGMLQQQTGQVEQALNTWSVMLGAIDRVADHAFYVRALNQLGHLLAALARLPQARLMFQRSLEQDAGQPEIAALEEALRPPA